MGSEPRKIKYRLKVDIWATFSHSKHWWVGSDLIQETDYKKPNPTNFPTNTAL